MSRREHKCVCVSLLLVNGNAKDILFYSLPGDLSISCGEGQEDLVEVSQ